MERHPSQGIAFAQSSQSVFWVESPLGIKREMRILICGVSRFLQPTGICRHTVNLANCLVGEPKVSSVTLVIGSWQEDYHRRYLSLDPRIEVVVIRGSNNSYWRNAWFAFGLPRLAARMRADVVHLAFPIPLLRKFEASVVASLHDLYPYDYPANNKKFVRLFKKAVLSQCLSRADGVAVVSNATLSSLYNHFDHLRGRNIRLVSNYPVLELTKAEPELGKQLGKFILCVAQHESNKQLDLALSAFASLIQKVDSSGLSLVIVGSGGSQTERLEDLSERLGIAQRVHWAPPLKDSELSWLYSNCELFMSTSAVEGFCLPLAEAIASGARVACTDIPSHREVAGSFPRYFLPVADPGEIAKVISDLLKRPKPPARLHLTAQKTAAAALSLYEDIFARRFGASSMPDRSEW
jgi:glycosyltransferase involved in cell wall biosynthesis